MTATARDVGKSTACAEPPTQLLFCPTPFGLSIPGWTPGGQSPGRRSLGLVSILWVRLLAVRTKIFFLSMLRPEQGEQTHCCVASVRERKKRSRPLAPSSRFPRSKGPRADGLAGTELCVTERGPEARQLRLLWREMRAKATAAILEKRPCVRLAIHSEQNRSPWRTCTPYSRAVSTMAQRSTILLLAPSRTPCIPALARGSNSTLPYVGGRKQSWQRPRVAQGRLCGGAMLQMQARLLHARHR